MRVRVASEAGRPDGRNEDWAGATNHVAVVLDGLSEAPETGCIHGTPWYVRQLGARLVGLADEAILPLPIVLASAIREVAELHQGSCDLRHPGSPCSTVAMIRHLGENTEFLILSDSLIVLDRKSDSPLVLQDKAVDAFASHAAATAIAAAGSDDESALTALIQEQQKIRNKPGGYWVAQVDPSAAQHAKTGSVTDVRGAALLSDGAALLVTDFHTMDWPALLTLAYQEGPAELIARTRELEDQDPHGETWPRYKHRDDATAVICVM